MPLTPNPQTTTSKPFTSSRPRSKQNLSRVIAVPPTERQSGRHIMNTSFWPGLHTCLLAPRQPHRPTTSSEIAKRTQRKGHARRARVLTSSRRA
eukprot:433010-Rhodomonas_salina.1